MNATETAPAIEQAPVQESEAVRVPVVVGKNHPAFAPLKWVLQARSTDTTRAFMNGVFIESDGIYVSTDGSRLHLVEHAPVLPAGNYKAQVNGKSIVLEPFDAQFPNWRNVIPKGKPRTTIELHAPADSRYQNKGMAIGRIAVQIGLLINVDESVADQPRKPGCYVNVEYLKELLGESWTLEVRENRGVLKFTRGNDQSIRHTALIMPAQLPE